MARRDNDFYETPYPVVATLMRTIALPHNKAFLEPCSGDEAISRLFLGQMITNDIDGRWPAEFHYDATGPELYEAVVRKYCSVEWVITNPPFSAAHLILPRCYDLAADGVAFLLRLTYLEPVANRADWLKEHAKNLSNLIIFNPRPSFTIDGKTDSVTVAWMVWRKHILDGTRVTFVTDWRVP